MTAGTSRIGLGVPSPSRTNGAPIRYGLVDDLRGLAALAVVLSHTTWLLPEPWPALEIARLGVEVFFVISGFVMAYTLERQQVTGRFAFGFMVRRSIRLDPPYWCIIAVELIVVAVFWSAPRPSLRDLAINMIYLQDLANVPSIVFVAWTLCIELQFYLVFALALVLVRRLPFDRWMSRVVVFLPLFAVSLLLGVTEWWVPGIWRLNVTGLFLDVWYLFFLGVIVKWVVIDRAHWALGVAGPALVLVTGVGSGAEFFPYEDLSSFFGALVALGLMAAGATALFRHGLGLGVVDYLSRISYSLYLTHVTIGTNLIYFVQERTGPAATPMWLAAIAAIGLSIVAAHLLYVCVERPSVDLAKRAKSWPILQQR